MELISKNKLYDNYANFLFGIKVVKFPDNLYKIVYKIPFVDELNIWDIESNKIDFKLDIINYTDILIYERKIIIIYQDENNFKLEIWNYDSKKIITKYELRGKYFYYKIYKNRLIISYEFTLQCINLDDLKAEIRTLNKSCIIIGYNNDNIILCPKNSEIRFLIIIPLNQPQYSKIQLNNYCQFWLVDNKEIFLIENNKLLIYDVINFNKKNNIDINLDMSNFLDIYPYDKYLYIIFKNKIEKYRRFSYRLIQTMNVNFENMIIRKKYQNILVLNLYLNSYLYNLDTQQLLPLIDNQIVNMFDNYIFFTNQNDYNLYDITNFELILNLKNYNNRKQVILISDTLIVFNRYNYKVSIYKVDAIRERYEKARMTIFDWINRKKINFRGREYQGFGFARDMEKLNQSYDHYCSLLQ